MGLSPDTKSMIDILIALSLSGTIWFCIVFIIARLWKSASPSTLYLLWGLVLFRFILPPHIRINLGFLTPGQFLSKFFSTMPLSSETRLGEVLTAVAGSQSPDPLPQAQISFLHRLPDISYSGIDFVFICWLTGFLTIILLQCYRHIRVIRFLRQLQPVGHRRVVLLLTSLQQRLHIRRSILVRTSTNNNMPFTYGIIKPVIVLPHQMVSHASVDELSAVLYHECIHIKRFDGIWNLVQCFVNAVYFFHPVIWYTDRQIRTYREMSCDEETHFYLHTIEQSTFSYSRFLVHMAESYSTRNSYISPAHTFLNPSTHLRQRIKALLHFPHFRTPDIPIHAFGIILGLFLLFFPFTSDISSTLHLHGYTPAVEQFHIRDIINNQYLTGIPIAVDRTDTIHVNGTSLEEGKDYAVDAQSGQILFLHTDTIQTGAHLDITQTAHIEYTIHPIPTSGINRHFSTALLPSIATFPFRIADSIYCQAGIPVQIPIIIPEARVALRNTDLDILFTDNTLRWEHPTQGYHKVQLDVFHPDGRQSIRELLFAVIDEP